MSELDEVLTDNAERRAAERERLEAQAAEAADAIDRMAHPHEADHEREARHAAEAERQRLRSLGVVLR